MEYLLATDTRGNATSLHVVEIKADKVYFRIYTHGTFGIDFNVHITDVEEMILRIRRKSTDTNLSQYTIKITAQSIRVEKDDVQCLLGSPEPDGFARLKKDLHL